MGAPEGMAEETDEALVQHKIGRPRRAVRPYSRPNSLDRNCDSKHGHNDDDAYRVQLANSK